METAGKTAIVAAIITAAGGIIAAFVIAGDDDGGDPPRDQVPISKSGQEPSGTDCPRIPPDEQPTPAARENYTWAPGDWSWNGTWTWKPGHWERARNPPRRYIRGRWDTSDGRCTWVAGGFDDESGNIKVRDNR